MWIHGRSRESAALFWEHTLISQSEPSEESFSAAVNPEQLLRSWEGGQDEERRPAIWDGGSGGRAGARPFLALSLPPPIYLFPPLKPPSLSAGSSVMSNALIQNTALCVRAPQPDGPLREGRRRSGVFIPLRWAVTSCPLFPLCMWCLMIKYFGSTCEQSLSFLARQISFRRVQDWRSSPLKETCPETNPDTRSAIHLWPFDSYNTLLRQKTKWITKSLPEYLNSVLTPAICRSIWTS